MNCKKWSYLLLLATTTTITILIMKNIYWIQILYIPILGEKTMYHMKIKTNAF